VCRKRSTCNHFTVIDRVLEGAVELLLERCFTPSSSFARRKGNSCVKK
jgi:hypothetical protein